MLQEILQVSASHSSHWRYFVMSNSKNSWRYVVSSVLSFLSLSFTFLLGGVSAVFAQAPSAQPTPPPVIDIPVTERHPLPTRGQLPMVGCGSAHTARRLIASGRRENACVLPPGGRQDQLNGRETGGGGTVRVDTGLSRSRTAWRSTWQCPSTRPRTRGADGCGGRGRPTGVPRRPVSRRRSAARPPRCPSPSPVGDGPRSPQ